MGNMGSVGAASGFIFTFNKQCEVPDDVGNLLVSGEKALKAYKDTAK